ncbi:helix-turn-helix domain-containing protein [Parafrankia sp. FMc2]|uniref:helix-turn-helix domain-containing protein n=1 Tax=Parafrankia sp. FMc2 TaxID=3233196 RepID=UPI0034D4F2EA
MASPSEELGELLAALKKRSGHNYEWLGRKVNASKSTVHRYCTGRSVPSEFGPLERIARTCGADSVEIAQLFRAWERATAASPGADGAAPVRAPSRKQSGGSRNAESSRHPESDAAAGAPADQESGEDLGSAQIHRPAETAEGGGELAAPVPVPGTDTDTDTDPDTESEPPPPPPAELLSAPRSPAVAAVFRLPRRRGRRVVVLGAVVALLLGAVGIALAVAPGDEVRAGPLGPPLASGADWALSAVFSPDEQLMATSNRTGEVRLWDVSDRGAPRRLPLVLTGPLGGVTSIVFSPDGRMLAGGDWRGTVWLWDVTDRRRPAVAGRSLAGHTGPVWSVVFSADGLTLASGSDDRTVRLWDIASATPTQLAQFTGDTAYVTSVAFSADGRILAAGGNSRVLLLWDVTDRSAPRRLRSEVSLAAPGYAVAFSPQDRTLAVGDGGGAVQLLDLTDPKTPRPLGRPLTGHTNRVWTVAFAPDGRTLASGSFDRTVRLWDVADPARPAPRGRPLEGHGGWVLSVRFAPDGDLLASAGADRTVRLWSTP